MSNDDQWPTTCSYRAVLPTMRSIPLALALVASSACNLPFGQTPPAPITGGEGDPQVVALRQLQAASTTATDLEFEYGFPTFVSGRIAVPGMDPGERARNFLTTYEALYLQDNPDLALRMRRTAGVGGQDVTFYQLYKEIPVYAGELVVSLDGENVHYTVGDLLTVTDVDITPTITAGQAEEAARRDAGQSDALLIGETTLMVFDHSLLADVPPDPHLSWRVTLGAPASVLTHVDAHTGEILFSYSLITSGFWLDFKDANFTDSVWCYFLSPDDQTIGTIGGLDPRYSGNVDAVNGFRFSKEAYDFFRDTPYIRRDSYDNSGGGIEVYINANTPNAAWTGWGCNLIEFRTGWVSWDVMVHELAHGVIDHTSQLVYANQPGALNESFCDVMGSLADPEDWTVAEDRTNGLGAIRDFANPPTLGQPDRFSNYVVTTADNGGVHTNSGILNKVAFLLVAGGEHNGFRIRSIGRNRMGALFYSVLTGLPTNASFMATRNAMVARAYADPSLSSHRACQVQNAFAAVDLGNGDRDCDGIDDLFDPDRDGDYIPDGVDVCPNVPDPRQADLDSDGRGDACDRDVDGDGVDNDIDNCMLVANSSQADGDGNNVGDACQDSDDDGTIEIVDNCPSLYNRDQADVDGDDRGDVCDGNIDGDMFANEDDLCPYVANDHEVDGDGDRVGDSCDNCEFVSNPGQEDTDGDEYGDACDADIDNDGVENDRDNCPYDYNTAQWDVDGNGVGGVCDEHEQVLLEGIGFPADIIGSPRDLVKARIPVCLAGCPEFFSPAYRVSVLLGGLSDNVRVWISDSSGRTVNSAPLVDSRKLSFQPFGGEQYFINFAFGEDFPDGGRESYGMRMTAGTEEPSPVPPPGIPAAPTELVATTTTCDASGYVVTLEWKNNSEDESGIRVYRDGESIVTLGAGRSSFVDQPGDSGPHTYWVEVYNSAGSARSNSDSDDGCVF